MSRTETMAKQQRTSIALSLMVSSILAGCGGGGGGGNNMGNNPPPSGNNPPMLTGDTFAVTNANRLVSFNAATPGTAAAVNVTGLANGENILAVDRRPGGATPGQIYAVTSMFNVYTIDPSSGAATMKAKMSADPSDTTMPFQNFTGTRISIDVNNFVDQLRVIGNDGQNLRVMMDTGATFSDTPMTIGGNQTSTISEVAYTNNFSATCRNTVFYIDTGSDRLMTSVNASAGILTPVGPLGLDAQAIAGFDISTGPDGSNTAYAALSVMGTVSLYTINLTTGQATSAGTIGSLNTGETIVGLVRPSPATAPAQAVGELLALTDNNGLVSFMSGFPSKLCTSTTVSGLQGAESVLGIDVRPSDRNVYAVTSAGRLYTVNATTGTATTVATLSADPTDNTDPYTPNDLNGGIAMDVSPAADQLRAYNGNGKNLRVNLNTGVVTSDIALSAAGLNPANASIATISYTNGFAGTVNNTLYLIDSTNDRLLTTPAGATGGVLANVGSLAIQGDVQAVAGLEINAVNNSAFAALQVGNATSSDLYNINLSTGAATRVGSIGTTARVRKITYASPPVATLVGITTNNQLVTFSLGNPGTFTSTMPITGMQGGEMAAGLDIRPSNQTAYILSNGARVYSLNQTTGMATITGALTPAANSGFSSLQGANFGTDFSPPADALRIYTDAEQNLAVLADSGQVALQATSLRRGQNDVNAATAPDIFAIAYTNNYANAASTVLYSIDAPTNSLISTNPANGGVLNTVGRLTTTSTAASFTLTGGLDIVGGDNGLALAALQPIGATQSTLYFVNLATGLLTPVTNNAATSVIGPAGTQPLVGFTIRFQ
jgi:trimeric autotransporter adhesin